MGGIAGGGAEAREEEAEEVGYKEEYFLFLDSNPPEELEEGLRKVEREVCLLGVEGVPGEVGGDFEVGDFAGEFEGDFEGDLEGETKVEEEEEEE